MTRIFSRILLISMIIIVVMSPVIGANSLNVKEASESVTARELKNNKQQIVKEVFDRRGPNYKNYLLSDGSYEMEIHQETIHYKDENGNYQDINMDLVDEANILKTNIPMSKDAATVRKKNMSIKANNEPSSFTSFQVPFYSQVPKEFSKGYSIESEGERLTFIPVNASDRSIGKIISNDKSKIIYQNVWSNTDVELQLTSEGIKENIILKNEKSPKLISFEVAGNLRGEQLFIESPWIKDANGTTRSVRIIERTEGYKKFFDYEWDSEGLVYPAVIDPNVSVQLSNVGCANKYYLTYGCSSSNLQIAYKNFNPVSSDKIYGETFRSYVRFNLPVVTDVAYTNATLNLSQSASNSFQGSLGPTIAVKPYALAGEWRTDWHGVAWPGAVLYESEDVSSTYNVTMFSSAPSRSVQFDVTGMLNYYLNKKSTSIAVALTATSLSVPSHLPDKEYTINFSNPTLNLTYRDLAPPSKPSELIVTGVTNNSVSLSWRASVDNLGTVYYQISGNGSVITTYYTNSYTASGLKENTKYTFTIRAMDGSGNLSAESNPVTVTTGTKKPIANFLNLSENEKFINPLLIKWSYYDPSGRSLTAYQIKGSNDNWTTIAFDTGVVPAVTPVHYTSNLLNVKPWSFAIRVDNGLGMGDWTYINNIKGIGKIEYFYDSSGRIDYLIFDGKLKIKYDYDNNGNLIGTDQVYL